MQKYKVIVTWEAIYDIAEIADYLQKRSLGQRGLNLCYRGYSIYKNPFPPSVIFYIIIESEKEIHVLRVLREERDWESILARQHDYTY